MSLEEPVIVSVVTVEETSFVIDVVTPPVPAIDVTINNPLAVIAVDISGSPVDVASVEVTGFVIDVVEPPPLAAVDVTVGDPAATIVVDIPGSGGEDEVIGGKITIGATPPVSPGINDVWIDTSGEAAVVGDVYVDSVVGVDANPGTLAEPKQTLAGVTFTNGMTLLLKRGSIFRETLSAPGIIDVTVDAYGTGAMPVLDCADVTANTGWTQPDAGGSPNVWAKAIANTSDLDANFASIWENGVRLLFVTSRALCNATAGTFCITGSSVGNYGASSTTFEINATGASKNPNTNGKTYETAVRAAGIGTGSGWVIRNLRAKRNAHNNGSIGMAAGSSAFNCIAEDGVKHNVICERNTEMTDCIAYNCAYPHPARDGWTGFVAFETDPGASASASFTRCKAILPRAVLTWKQANSGNGLTGFYGHTAGGGPVWATITLTDCVAQFCDDGMSVADTTTLTIVRPRIAGCSQGIKISQGTITDAWVYEEDSVILNRGIERTASLPVTITGARIWSKTDANNGQVYDAFSTSTLDVTRSCFARTTGAAEGYQYLVRSVGTALSMTGCVLFGANTGFGEAALKRGVGATRPLNNNAYGNDGLDFEIGAASYGDVPAYLAAGTGYDGASVATGSTSPFTDAANGNFALTSLSSAIYGCERFPTYESIPSGAAIAAM